MSGIVMLFPNTVDEFMNQYKMVDNKHVYSNGIEYVPIFRMKQWFDHQSYIDAVEVVRCKDCYHFDVVNQPYDENWCTVMEDCVGPDGFCYRGKRREK